MITGTRNTHSSAPALLGYFYQCRYALLEALRRLPSENRISIAIETLDDVVFAPEGKPIELLQTKHHTKSPGNLSDSSVDLWKTLRIWIDEICEERIDIDARFFLITTTQCATGTAAAYLRPGNRDPKTALERLHSAATVSSNQTNLPAYHSFKSLPAKMRERLVNSITVLDNSPPIGQLDEDLKTAVYFAAERRHLGFFVRLLESWWYRRVVAHLQEAVATPISGDELEAECRRIRDQLRQDNLPVVDDIMSKAVGTSEYDKRTFVKQLNLIDVNVRRRLHAITNYYRASEQRSLWVREQLLYAGELDRYDTRLNEEWDIRFQQMKDELGDDAADQAIIRAGKDLYKWIETGTHHQIRTAVTEPSIARGTYQIMSDLLRVGWHPEFRTLLQNVPSAEVSQ